MCCRSLSRSPLVGVSQDQPRLGQTPCLNHVFDWLRDTDTLWVWIADGVCTVDQFALPECPSEPSCPCRFVIRSETATPKPRVLTINEAPGGTRTLIVANLGPREETVQYRVTLLSSVRSETLVSGSEVSPPRGSHGRKAIRNRLQ